MVACDCLFRGEEADDQFFDSREDLSSVFDSCCNSPGTHHVSYIEDRSSNLVISDPLYQVWIKSPGSVQERRARFMKHMCLDSFVSHGELTADDEYDSFVDKIPLNFDSVFREPSSVKFDEAPSTSLRIPNAEQFDPRIESLDCGRAFVAHESNHDVSLLGSNSVKALKRKKFRWLRRLGSLTCIVYRKGYRIDSELMDPDESAHSGFRRVHVHLNNKQLKEFSAVYLRQNFKAHIGAILAMKFSPDGQYLASGGEDGVVRIWRVMESARNGEDCALDNDPSCIYFSVSNQSKVSPLIAEKLKRIKPRIMSGSSNSACIAVPSNVFEISKIPLYEFHGHEGDVLDLAWSKDKCLLSSSIDKTVRLWQLGRVDCLKVFAHNNYVTCVQFNPIDGKYFVSGSIDGKVRIWKTLTCRVVNWIDAKQIVTAICYRPDGKGLVVGSMLGDCHFYDASSDDDLQLYSKVSFEGKKKSLDKRITGIQFCPGSCSLLMVTSADRAIRILKGTIVVSKYKGLRNSGSQISATFMPDGRHIVSASADSNVYIWNTPDSKSIWSSERFTSSHVSVAVPWPGFLKKSSIEGSENDSLCGMDYMGIKILCLLFSSNFSLTRELFADFILQGSTTWPEEKLASCIMAKARTLSTGRSHPKFLKTSFQKNCSHFWGQVIVTAGCDGRIRSFQNYGLPIRL